MYVSTKLKMTSKRRHQTISCSPAQRTSLPLLFWLLRLLHDRRHLRLTRQRPHCCSTTNLISQPSTQHRVLIYLGPLRSLLDSVKFRSEVQVIALARITQSWIRCPPSLRLRPGGRIPRSMEYLVRLTIDYRWFRLPLILVSTEQVTETTTWVHIGGFNSFWEMVSAKSMSRQGSKES